jgi:hypothetical protein
MTTHVTEAKDAMLTRPENQANVDAHISKKCPPLLNLSSCCPHLSWTLPDIDGHSAFGRFRYPYRPG